MQDGRHIAARAHELRAEVNVHPAFLELARQYKLGDQVNVLIEVAIPFHKKHLALSQRQRPCQLSACKSCSYNEDATANLVQMQEGVASAYNGNLSLPGKGSERVPGRPDRVHDDVRVDCVGPRALSTANDDTGAFERGLVVVEEPRQGVLERER